jgi:hypothetical protein
MHLCATPANAQSVEKAPLTWRDVWKWREAWAGVDVSKDAWLIYSGITVAPWGHIHEDGWRVRVAGGYGGYKYSGNRSITEDIDIQKFKAQTHFTDVLAGYLTKWGPLTAKAFGGVSLISHQIAPLDPENIAVGDEWGAKGVIELWFDITPEAYAALDLSWSTAHDARSARTRVGYRMTPTLSIGLEAGLNIDAQGDCDLGWTSRDDCGQQARLGKIDRDLLDYTRGGAFLRYEWDGGEIAVSGGVAGRLLGQGGDGDPEPYLTLNYITQW